ncbi:hypothetical protein FHY04_000733 [Sphingomonas sp. BK481]|nr:hypothetical protein [Sphingomonas sp. BK481]
MNDRKWAEADKQAGMIHLWIRLTLLRPACASMSPVAA